MDKNRNWISKSVRQKLRNYKAKLWGIPIKIAVALSKMKRARKTRSPLEKTMQDFSSRYGTDYITTILAKGWITPGKMFDELGSIFEQNRKLFILGDEADVSRLRHKLSFLDVPIEAHAIPARKLLNDFAELKRISELQGYTLIIAYQGEGWSDAVATALIATEKYYLNVNMFYEGDFIGVIPESGDYCGIFAVYTKGKVYLKHQNMLVTTICNLNCEYCLNYNPYNKHQKHFDMQELKHCVDIYFSKIDRVGFFELTGGEPTLYPNLQELILYIAQKYGDKIDEFTFVTNGSTVFSDEFCELLKENNVTVLIDDYTAAVPRLEENLSKLKERLKKVGTKFIVYPQMREFLKSFPPKRENMNLTEEGLKEKYRICTIGVQNLRDGRLCSCTYHAFAVNAGLIPDNTSDWFDLSTMPDDLLGKKTLIEFRCGFNQNGYTAWCRFCNGVQTINTNYAPAAEQVKGHLEWDINDPTYLN